MSPLYVTICWRTVENFSVTPGTAVVSLQFAPMPGAPTGSLTISPVFLKLFLIKFAPVVMLPTRSAAETVERPLATTSL